MDTALSLPFLVSGGPTSQVYEPGYERQPLAELYVVFLNNNVSDYTLSFTYTLAGSFSIEAARGRL